MDVLVPKELNGERLDKVLAALGCYKSRREAREAVVKGAVYLDGRRVRIASRPVRDGALLRCEPLKAQDTPMPRVTILWESLGLLALNKPGGVPFAPTREAVEGSLLHALARERGVALGSVHPVHRLDTPTSGVVLVALDRQEAARLGEALRRGRVKKKYLAVVHGIPEPEEGEWNWPLSSSAGNVVRVAQNGKAALTRYRLLRRLRSGSLLLLEPLTGRTHQLRVHCAEAGHPILGDRKYGRETKGFPRALLHSWKITFPGRSGEIIEVESPVPEDFRAKSE